MKWFTTLGILAGLFLCAGVSFSQFVKSPVPVVDLTKADQAAIYKVTKPNENRDQMAVIDDVGPYNVSVNCQHRVTAATPGPDGSMPFHSKITEIYYITDGSATLVTVSGPITSKVSRGNARAGGFDGFDYSKEEVYKTLVNDKNPGSGPGGSAVFGGTPKSRKLEVGDIVIIPPYTGHYFSQITGHVDYLDFRVDADHTMPAGYVNPALRALGRSKP